MYRIEDNDGNVIYDYQQNHSEAQAISFDTATIMNKLLHLADQRYGYGCIPTAANMVRRDDLTRSARPVRPKTTTTCGTWAAQPLSCAASGTATNIRKKIYDTNSAKKMYNGIIDWMEANYYDFLHSGSYVLSDNVVQLSYCRDSGLRPANCVHIANGWYSQNNIPRTCDGGSDHISRTSATATPSPSIEPSMEPSPSPSVEPTASPTAEATPTAPTATPAPTPGAYPEPTPGAYPEPAGRAYPEPPTEQGNTGGVKRFAECKTMIKI